VHEKRQSLSAAAVSNQIYACKDVSLVTACIVRVIVQSLALDSQTVPCSWPRSGKRAITEPCTYCCPACQLVVLRSSLTTIVIKAVIAIVIIIIIKCQSVIYTVSETNVTAS